MSECAKGEDTVIHLQGWGLTAALGGAAATAAAWKDAEVVVRQGIDARCAGRLTCRAQLRLAPPLP